MSYGANSKCAGKSWSWRIEYWVKFANPTMWSRHGRFWSHQMANLGFKIFFFLLDYRQSPGITATFRRAAGSNNRFSKNTRRFKMIWINKFEQKCFEIKVSRLVSTVLRQNKYSQAESRNFTNTEPIAVILFYWRRAILIRFCDKNFGAHPLKSCFFRVGRDRF